MERRKKRLVIKPDYLSMVCNMIQNKCEYCYGHTAILWKNDRNCAYIDSDGIMMVISDGCVITFKVDYCPMCGRKFSDAEDYMSLGPGDDIWYVDYEFGALEKGKIVSVEFKDSKVYTFAVEFDGDFDVFDAHGLGRHFFIKQSNALQELHDRKYVND